MQRFLKSPDESKIPKRKTANRRAELGQSLFAASLATRNLQSLGIISGPSRLRSGRNDSSSDSSIDGDQIEEDLEASVAVHTDFNSDANRRGVGSIAGFRSFMASNQLNTSVQPLVPFDVVRKYS